MAGQSMMFSGPVNKIPAGWLIEDGSAISRTAYATLFAVIGTTYGPGDGVNTFNVPDSRADVWRGLDLGKGKDVGRVLGTKQGDAGRNLEGIIGRMFGTVGSATGPFESYDVNTFIIPDGTVHGTTNVRLDASRQWPVAPEFRMLNIAKIPLIKYS